MGFPNSKDFSIWGSILGPPMLGNLHIVLIETQGSLFSFLVWLFVRSKEFNMFGSILGLLLHENCHRAY